MKMETIGEGVRSPEVKEYASRVILSFMRHAEKETDASKADGDIELTPKGKQQAVAKHGAENPDQTVAFGDDRTRTRETALLAALGNDILVGNQTLQEIEAKANENLKLGSKVGTDTRLGVGTIDRTSDFTKAAIPRIRDVKDYVKFLAEESDQLAEKFGDKTAPTYSRKAADVAEIIEKYLAVSQSWDKLVKEGKYKEETLWRKLGSQQGVLESFLMKVLENRKGIEERNKFVGVVGNTFDFTEGFDTEIITKADGTQEIEITYKKEVPGQEPFEIKEKITKEDLDRIIAERK
jgi:hypothetical protein